MFKLLIAKTGKKKYYILITIIALLFVSLLQFYLPQVTQSIIDEVIPSKNRQLLMQKILLLLAISAGLGILSYISTVFISIVSQHAISDLRADLYAHILTLDTSYFEHSKTGDIMTRVIDDIRSMQDLISPNTLSMLGNIVTFFSVLFYMIYNQWQLTLLIALTFPFLYVVNRFFGKVVKAAFRKVRETSSRINHTRSSSSAISTNNS